MSLIRRSFEPTFARLLLAVALVCALFVTQFGLSRHIVEHAAKPLITATTIHDPVSAPDTANCLTCLEYQAHGASLTSRAIIFTTEPVRTFEQQALSPNAPYLAPERASQRAPPVLS